MRSKEGSTGGPAAKPQPSWLVGATIGLTILSMASGAMVLGAGIALTHPTRRRT